MTSGIKLWLWFARCHIKRYLQYRQMWRIYKGVALGHLGRSYGVERWPDEGDRHYRWRICKRAQHREPDKPLAEKEL